MELRRALLLFAIVLGLAAIVSSITSTRDDDGGDEKSTATESSPPSEPAAGPQPGTEAAELITIRFPAAKDKAKDKKKEKGERKGQPRRRLEQGQPATVLVDVDQAGQVELEGLGLTDTAEPLTPAMFDVLTQRPGKYAVILAPASGSSPRTVGVLEVVGDG